jgi:hypothetical protein
MAFKVASVVVVGFGRTRLDGKFCGDLFRDFCGEEFVEGNLSLEYQMSQSLLPPANAETQPDLKKMRSSLGGRQTRDRAVSVLCFLIDALLFFLRA